MKVETTADVDTLINLHFPVGKSTTAYIMMAKDVKCDHLSSLASRWQVRLEVGKVMVAGEIR